MKINKRFSTRAIHIGNKPDSETGSVSPPIHLTSTFQQINAGIHKGFDYSRASNPTRKRLEENLAALENGKFGIAFSSGIASITALFQTFSSGDHLIVGRNVYGGTYRLLLKVMSRYGIEFDFVDLRNLGEVESAIKENTKLVFLETPTNPMLELCDIKEISRICKSKNILLAVDNTFMSPYGQSPLDLGADVVMHSTTKFIGGHSDLLSGALITNDKELAENFYFIQKSGGAVPSPFDCWLLLRSTKTIALRVQKHSDNALELAKKLNQIPSIDEVIYPGLKSHKQYELALRQQLNPNSEPIFGSIITLRCKTVEQRNSFISSLKLFSLAESLGGVESLVCIPYEMTHVSVPDKVKYSMGLTKEIVRLSIGIENVDDLQEDLLKALKC